MEFTKEDKQPIVNRLPFGVHKVEILGFKLDKTNDAKEFIEVGFVTTDGIEDKTRIWFVSPANRKISFDTFRTILIHNTIEANRPKAKEVIDAVANTEKLVELLNSKLIGKEMWVTKYIDPNRTYHKDGLILPSVNLNIMGYEPTLNPSLMPKPNQNLAQNVKEVFGTTIAVDSEEVTNWS